MKKSRDFFYVSISRSLQQKCQQELITNFQLHVKHKLLLFALIASIACNWFGALTLKHVILQLWGYDGKKWLKLPQSHTPQLNRCGICLSIFLCSKKKNSENVVKNIRNKLINFHYVYSQQHLVVAKIIVTNRLFINLLLLLVCCSNFYFTHDPKINFKCV